jgi:hypothetical protein
MPLDFRSFGLACTLVFACAVLALCSGCGGGTLTPEESAQHAADMQALEALAIGQGDRKTIPAPVSPSASSAI